MNTSQVQHMKRIVAPADMRQFVREQKMQGKTVGYVPTMGFLHEGHLSLFRRAAETSDCVVASIFVNPTQFGDREDYENYPHDKEHDAILAEEAGVSALFLPEETSVYPNGTDFSVKVNAKTDVLCGLSRPGHFDGVATVLTKLFNIVEPDHVYFGMKDAQQAAVVAGLIKAFHFPAEMFLCPTVREKDGLALSSRNARLSTLERKEAPELYRGLKTGLDVMRKGERRAERIITSVKAYYQNHLKWGKIDYIDLLPYPELAREKSVISGKFILACAVNYARARLIDNIIADTENLLPAENRGQDKC